MRHRPRFLFMEDTKNLKTRPPVVTLMGHVDHGKTSLLDAIRGSKVAGKEHGGITQHISAYQVDHQGKKITFIDTPGHEVFYEMRSRGAKVTDIVVLVVAADDGVMPQTKESISIIKKSESPFLVAVNKTDTPGANLDKVKQQLAESEVLVEGYGGNVPLVAVSAKTKAGLDELLEVTLLMAELEELKDSGELEGIVVEARNDPFRGPLALVLVKNGTLRLGDQVFSGKQKFKIKSLSSTTGEAVKEAVASTPVEVLGFVDVPRVGELITKVGLTTVEVKDTTAKKKLTAADLFVKARRKIKLILKADVQGSLEALVTALNKIEGDHDVDIIKEATGEITDNDILLAASSAEKALIIGFNVGPVPSAKKLADTEGVTIKTFNLIYELLEVIEKQTLFADGEKEIVAKAEVVKAFDTPAGKVAGLKVVLGTFNQGDAVRLVRGDNKTVGNSKIASIHHQAEIVGQADEGKEYGFLLSPILNFSPGDVIAKEA